MIALVQRVSEASVSVEGEVTGKIGRGLLVLIGVGEGDTEEQAKWLARKVATLRVFPDADGRMNRSLLDVGGEALVVSQFTLYGAVKKGTRPSFSNAAASDLARRLYNDFVRRLGARLGHEVPTGVFGAKMDVALVNEGPVTLWLQREAEE